MALNSTGYPVRSRDVQVSHLYAKVAIGASGAPTLSSGRGLSIARTAAGDYTVTVSDATGGVPEILYAAATIHVQSDQDRTVVGKGVSTANGTFQFTVLTAAVPTDPASGDTLQIVVVVRNSGRA